MIEHWYEYLPAAWFIPEARLPLILSVSIIFTLGFLVGYAFAKRKCIKH